MTTKKLVFAYDVAAPHMVHCYDASEWARGLAVVAHDELRRADEGMGHRNADEARDEAYARAARHGDRASVTKR